MDETHEQRIRRQYRWMLGCIDDPNAPLPPRGDEDEDEDWDVEEEEEIDER